MEGGITAILHAVLLVFLIIELGLTAYLVTIGSGYYHDATVNFLLFNSIWSILVLLYLAIVPRIFARLYHSIVGLGLSGLTSLFWFAGSIALAANIGTHCHGNFSCHVAQAAVAFGFFIWALFTALTVFAGLGARGGAGSKSFP